LISLPTVKQIVAAVNRLAPPQLAEEWDRVGLQVDREGAAVRRVMVALDLNSQVIQAGAGQSSPVDGFIVHHPFLFKPLTRISHATPQGRILAHLLANNQFVLAAHTNLDRAARGINQYLAERLGLTQLAPLEPAALTAYKVENDVYPAPNNAGHGLGRIGTLPEAVSLQKFGELVKTQLPAKWLRVSGAPERLIRKVALCSGSGGDLVAVAIQRQADLYLTGELNYHVHWEAREQGLAVIEAGHGATEQCFVPLMTAYLREVFPPPDELAVISSAVPEPEPYRVV
jgi:dinuclear metal center YbgI/SA1388 family protein